MPRHRCTGCGRVIEHPPSTHDPLVCARCGSPVRAATLGYEMVRLAAAAALLGGVVFTYTRVPWERLLTW